MYFKTFSLSFILIISSFVHCELPYTCNDNIYCYGNLLHVVQMSRINKDSKTFVDMKLKFDRSETLEKFDELMEQTRGQPNKTQVARFVDNYFDKPGSEFEEWTPSDWKENPKILNKIYNEDARQWVKDLNGLWKVLGRKMKNDVKFNEDKYSIIYVPNPVIVPGGRFLEFYYWDSYWIVEGLLHSEMFNTVKGMLSNFISMVDRIGFVPNGGRKYYKMRSQPPLLIPMVKLYLDATGDYQFLSQNIDTLEKELQFWLTNRTVSVEKGSKKYILARYADASAGPRPESYYEDVTHAKVFSTEEEKIAFYSQLKSAAESGWDFSSRWYLPQDGGTGELKDIKTKSIIPVDLNAIICQNAEILSEFYEKLNNHRKALIYARMAHTWKKAINKILWHDDVGSWLDYNIDDNERRNQFFASNLFPLWTKAYDESRDDIIVKVVNYLKRNKIMDFMGGVPSSLSSTGQQWDFPNAWPPSQYAIIIGLDTTENNCAKVMARNLAMKWVRSNFEAYKKTRSMFEKYDATVFGGSGGGGEYDVVLGFGWSNGIIMDLLNQFPDSLTSPELDDSECADNFISSDSSNTFAFNRFILVFNLIIPFMKQVWFT